MSETLYKGNNRLILALCLSVLTYWLFTTSSGAILPGVSGTLNVDQSVLTQPLSLAGLFSGVLIVAAGNFSDKYGRVFIINLGLFLNILGSLILILAVTPAIFGLGRCFQGASAAFIMPATLSLIKVYFKDKEQQRALSFWSIASWGGSGLSNMTAGFITTILDWKAVFITSIIISVIAYLLLMKTPESKSDEQSKKFDFTGLILLILTLLCLNTYINNYLKYEYLILFIIFCTLLIYTEIKKTTYALINLSIFKSLSFNSAVISNFLLNFMAGGLFIYVLYIQNLYEFTSMQAGFLTLGYCFSVLLTIRVGEKLLQTIGRKVPMLLGSLLAALGFILVSLTGLNQSNYLVISFVGLAVMGVGLGIYATPSTDTAVRELSESQIGMGTGAYKMASSLGGSLGVSFGGMLYSLNATISIQSAASVAFIATAAAALLSFFVIFFLTPNTK